MSPSFDRTPAARAFAATAVLALLSAGAVRGDDRDLLRAGTADPYLFILLDTSGSMNWSPKNSATCPSGDCYVPLQADDPQSKFYQAKQALYEVLNDPKFPAASLGFATYNQDALSVPNKHWLYQATSNGPSVPGWGSFPASGAQEIFGFNWGCDTGNNDNEIGCTFAKPADLVDPWELARVQRLPKGGTTFNATNVIDFFIRQSGVTYRVRYTPVNGGSYGGNLSVTLNIWTCLKTACDPTSSSSATAVTGSPKTVTYTPVSDFLSWDIASTNNPTRTNPELSYFTGAANDSAAANTCNGWDPNTDSNSDKSNNYSLRFTTDTSDSRGSLFYTGDVIPLDWTNSHKTDILRRLSPSYPAAPDYRIATYLKDNRSGAETFLRLKDEAKRPLFASGSTPIGNSFEYFKEWYTSWAAVAGSTDDAVAHDNGFSCRSKYLLILTDGDETCGGVNAPINNKSNDPCTVADQLRAQGVTVFVVAFGVTAASGNKLSCIADDQHTFYPQDKDELVQDLQKAIGLIKEDPRAFASAAVPSVQADVEDRIYLSTFRPINAFSFDDDANGKLDDSAFTWDGHLDAYLKPLPTVGGKPNTGKACPSSSPRSSCHLWDAGAVLKTQAPTQSALAASPTLDETTLKLGLSTGQRRLFYAKAQSGDSVPSVLRLLVPPAGDIKTDTDWKDLWRGFKIPDPGTNAQYTATKARVQAIVKRTIEIKETNVQNVGPVTWVLGDIFHSDPVLVDRPNNFFYYASNVGGAKGVTSDCSNASDPTYRCFAKKHRTRRKMLLVGANDGQLHAFDAGISSGGTFTAGKGTEIFSYMPRIGMSIVRDQTEGGRQIFGVDGTPRITDVFLDPNHSGVPDATKREWRTVAVGGFREGGAIDGGGRVADTDFYSGYYALDLTQPDLLTSDQGDIPSCLSLQNQTVSNCGTLPFPAVLWEFSDTYGGSHRMDEDQNSTPDLGQTWSVPTIGRIQVIEKVAGADTLVTKYVAIFGGGMDHDNKLSPKRGTWLYMVDMETGKVLYKRALVGAVPSDPAVVDVDLDGFLDTIYIGTTTGLLYKVDIKSPAKLEDVNFDKNQFIPPLGANVNIPRISDPGWDPFPIFDTGGKPIYIPPTAFFVSALGKFALALGTGDREDIWLNDAREGRFYLFVDDNFTADMVTSSDVKIKLPKSETNYKQILPGDGLAKADYVLDPSLRGWYLKLPVNQRVITQPFGLSGILIFSSFLPDKTPCSTGGTSNLYVVFANNGDPVMTKDGLPARARVIKDVVTNPVVEQGQTKNPPTDTSDPTPPADQAEQDRIQAAIVQTLKSLAPKECKFANFWFNVDGVRSDTGIERYATIPVCSIERNWKDN